MMQSFTAAQAAKLTDFSVNSIHHLERRNVLKPSLQSGQGKGRKRLFDFGDLIALRVARFLILQNINIASRQREVWSVLLSRICRRVRDDMDSIDASLFVIDMNLGLYEVGKESDVAALLSGGTGPARLILDVGFFVREIQEKMDSK